MRKVKRLFIVITLLLLAPCLLQAQKKATATVTPNPLQVYGDSVIFKATITVPADKRMAKGAGYLIMPELGEFKFQPVRIPASKLANAAKEGFTTTIRSTIPFHEDMIGNDLEIESEWEFEINGKNFEFNDMDDLAECCITSGMLFVNNSQYQLMRYEYEPGETVPVKVVAQFNYPLDIWQLEKEEYVEDVKQIGEYLKKYPDATITIRGYASPEGPYERNVTLAENRAKEAKDWLQKKLKESGYSKQYKPEKVRIETTTEDWQGFIEKLERSYSYSQEVQDNIRQIVSAGLPPEETEKRVMELVGGEDAVEELLKPLRRATVVVESEKAMGKARTAEELQSLVSEYLSGEIPQSALKDIFTQEEWLAAAQETNAPEGKISLLAAYYQTYPGDFRVYSDLGVMAMVDVHKIDAVGGDDGLVGIGFDRDEVDIDMEYDVDDDKMKYKFKYKTEDVDGIDIKYKYKADFEEVEDLFEKAYELEPTNYVVLSNMGAYYITEGDYHTAWNYLKRSVGQQETPGAHYNLGLAYAGIGNYQKAVEHFNKAGDLPRLTYNRGLAKMLAGDVEGAKKDFKAYIEDYPLSAIGHYMLAVAAARSGDQALLTKHLKQSIKINNKLSDISQEDLEFVKYWDEEWFEDASDDDPKE